MQRRSKPRGIDLIRDGVSSSDLRVGASKAVFGALISTAMSFQTRDWSIEQWRDAIDRPDSRLGTQLRLDSRRRPRTSNAVHRDLERAWAQAAENLSERPAPLSSDDIADWARACRNGLDALDLEQLPPGPARAALLGENQSADARGDARAVLRHVLAEGVRIGSTTPVVPARPTQEALGLPHTMRVSRALRRLREAGLLRLVEQGRRGRNSRVASRYGWDTTLLLRLTGTSQCPYGAMSNTVAPSTPAMSNTLPDSGRNTGSMDMSNTSSGTLTIPLEDGRVVTLPIPDDPAVRAELLSALQGTTHR